MKNSILFLLIGLFFITGIIILAGNEADAAINCGKFPNQCECKYDAAKCKQARCVSKLEPDLQDDAFNTTKGAGNDIINGIFNTVNSMMKNIASTFYNKVIQNTNYTNAVNALILLYITIYGIMIMFNLVSHRTGEIVKRLVKIGIIYSIMGPEGWKFFSTYIGDPVIGSLNELISEFSVAGGNGSISAVCSTPPYPPGCNASGGLSPISMNMLKGSMTLVFSLRFFIAIIALIFSNPSFGWICAVLIIWALIEFILMLIGAIITYVRAIVGLSFLFGLAPIFITFILFERSKEVFLGWVNAVLSHFLQPVMLFAFLGFYATLITNALINILFNSDYCWIKFMDIVLVTLYFWRPVDANHDLSGDFPWIVGQQPVIILIDILYFLLLTHVGKNLSKFIEDLSKKISGGSGPGVVGGEAVGKWFQNNALVSKVTGGRGIKQLAAAGAGGIKNKLIGGGNIEKEARRRGIGETPKDSSSGGETGGGRNKPTR